MEEEYSHWRNSAEFVQTHEPNQSEKNTKWCKKGGKKSLSTMHSQEVTADFSFLRYLQRCWVAQQKWAKKTLLSVTFYDMYVLTDYKLSTWSILFLWKVPELGILARNLSITEMTSVTSVKACPLLLLWCRFSTSFTQQRAVYGLLHLQLDERCTWIFSAKICLTQHYVYYKSKLIFACSYSFSHFIHYFQGILPRP